MNNYTSLEIEKQFSEQNIIEAVNNQILYLHMLNLKMKSDFPYQVSFFVFQPREIVFQP